MNDIRITHGTITYELEKFGLTAWFSPEVLSQIRVETRTDPLTRDMCIQMRGLVAKWRDRQLLQVPANWWEHLKERWFPRWALRRWPVLYTTHNAAVILPRVPVARPEWAGVQFAVWESD